MDILLKGKPTIKYIAFHHTAVKRGAGGKQFNAVNTYHQQQYGVRSSLGFYVGYNFFVEADGSITQARRIGEQQTAQIGHNCTGNNDCDTISVCLVGDFNGEMPTDAQVRAFKDLIRNIKRLYPEVQVVGHRDLQAGRTCPGLKITKSFINTEFNNLPLTEPEPDEEEKEKAKRIEALLQRVGVLRTLLAKLLSKK